MSEANNNKAIQDAKKGVSLSRKIYKEMPVGSSFAAKVLGYLGRDYMELAPYVPSAYLRSIVAYRRAAKIGHSEASLLQGAVMGEALFALDMSEAKREDYFKKAESLLLPYTRDEKHALTDNAKLYLGLLYFRRAQQIVHQRPSITRQPFHNMMKCAATNLEQIKWLKSPLLQGLPDHSDAYRALSVMHAYGWGVNANSVVAIYYAGECAKITKRPEDYFSAARLSLFQGSLHTELQDGSCSLARELARTGVSLASGRDIEEGRNLLIKIEKASHATRPQSPLKRIFSVLTKR